MLITSHKKTERSLEIVSRHIIYMSPNGSTISKEYRSSRLEGSNGLSFDRRATRAAIYFDRASARALRWCRGWCPMRTGGSSRMVTGTIRKSIRRSPGFRRAVRLSASSARAAALRGRRRRTRVLDHECVQAVRVRAGLPDARRRRRRAARLGANATGLAVQFARRRSSARRRPDQSDGECGRDRDDQPRAGRDARGEMAVHPRRVCRGSPAARFRSTKRCTPRRSETNFRNQEHRPAARRAMTGSTATRRRRPISTPGNAR